MCGIAIVKKGESSMKRSYQSLSIAILAGMAVLIAGLSWAQIGTQSQNPPQQKKVVEQKKEEPQEEYTEEEYNAYQAAADEKDQDKKAALILAFMEKYPKSKLLPNVTPMYDTLLYEVHKAGDWRRLDQMAEKWLKYNPDNIQLQAFIFYAAANLSNHQKAIEFGEKVYAKKPSAELASIIYSNYGKLGNKPKKLEWTLKLLEYPEYADNISLLWDLVAEYADKDLAKASLYAERALKVLPNAKKPADIAQADWSKTLRSVERGSYDIIGMSLYEKNQYPKAVETLQKALKVECYDSGYYYIAQCYWKMQQYEDARDNFAIADVLGGKMSAQAKQHCLTIHKELQNGTTIGLDRVYNRAKAAVEACKK